MNKDQIKFISFCIGQLVISNIASIFYYGEAYKLTLDNILITPFALFFLSLFFAGVFGPLLIIVLIIFTVLLDLNLLHINNKIVAILFYGLFIPLILSISYLIIVSFGSTHPH